jgi:tetratricopeptide (TPR) repeat protein
LAERCLTWFFCGFKYGERLPELTRDGERLMLSGDPELYAITEMFEAPDFDAQRLARHLEDGALALRETPVFAAVLAEELLDRKEYDVAREVLTFGLNRFPDELRLRQLKGLYYSRKGELEKAEKWMTPLYGQFRNDDETVGITAGVYKRLWQKDESNPKYLAMSHRAYNLGWQQSKKTNAYLGINAATTSLWLGRREESREIAGDVREILDRRADALTERENGFELVFDYWDRVTLAEAMLLHGDLTTARKTYLQAFEQHAEQLANIEVSRKQAIKILTALGLPDTEAESWLPCPSAARGETGV